MDEEVEVGGEVEEGEGGGDDFLGGVTAGWAGVFGVMDHCSLGLYQFLSPQCA